MSFFSFVVSKEGRKHLLRIVLVYAGIIGILWIFLRWYTDHGEQVSVPDLKGMSLDEAVSNLRDRNLEYLVVDSIFDEDAKAGNVLDQSPAPESKVKEGRQVFLTVYRTEPPMEKINIKEGEFAQVAIIKLKNKGLKYDLHEVPNNSMVGSVISVVYKGKKLKQDDRVPRGEKLILTVGISDNASVTVPNLTGKSYDEAMALLEGLNLMGQGIFEPEAKTTQDSINYRVCRQNPVHDPEGALIQPGKIIDFWLYPEPCNAEPDGQTP